MKQIPYGYCHCGCGKKTNLSNRDHAKLGWVKGQPYKFLVGHGRATMPVGSTQPPNLSGVCMCGCGRSTPLAIYTSHQTGNVKGFPRRFCVGHGSSYKHFVAPHNPGGLCGCGCGETTRISPLSRIDRGYAAGQPMNFVHNHHGRTADYLIEDRGHKTPCWIWQKYRDKNGYGMTTVNFKHGRAHRRYYERRFGAIPRGFDVDHLCHITSCVNPDHLSAVPPIINQRRKRTTKLNPALVLVIKAMRDSGQPFSKIAAYFHMNHRSIRNAYFGFTWRDGD